jgi:FkbM family methyltransferase
MREINPITAKLESEGIPTSQKPFGQQKMLPSLRYSGVFERFVARIAAGSISHFRRIPLRLQPQDIAHMKVSFSQFGEDLVIADHLINRKGAKKGIYIDAGCFNPFRFSNTRLINLLGWRGINIDASGSAIKLFKTHRPHDHNICAALSDKVESAVFYCSEGSATNRLDKEITPAPDGRNVKRIPVKTKVLGDIYRSSPFFGENVDLLTIDCEGRDLPVLKGFNFFDKRPLLVCIECHSKEGSHSIENYLHTLKYIPLCTRGPSHLFRDSQPQ